MVKYSKFDVYDFLTKKKWETSDRATAQLEKDLDEYVAGYVVKKFEKVDKAKVVGLVEALYAELDKIEFDYCTYNSKFYDLRETTRKVKLKTEKYGVDQYFKEDVEKTTETYNIPDYNQMKTNINEIRKEVAAEFKKLEALVKRTKSGAEAVAKLKELGFDTSTIKPTTPVANEVAVININNDLLGLPETGTELAEATTF